MSQPPVNAPPICWLCGAPLGGVPHIAVECSVVGCGCAGRRLCPRHAAPRACGTKTFHLSVLVVVNAEGPARCRAAAGGLLN